MSPTTTRDLGIKWSVYALAIAFLLLLHSLTGAHLRVWGVVPFLPPLLLAVVVSMEERLEGVVFGLVFGVLCDLALTAPMPWLYTVSFTAAALLSDAYSCAGSSLSSSLAASERPDSVTTEPFSSMLMLYSSTTPVNTTALLCTALNLHAERSFESWLE